MLFAITVFLAIIFIIPQDAFAWGPATHLELGLRILKDYGELHPAVGSLIGKFSFDFLYGNISADIVVGKNLAEELKHCHNWSFGFKLLKRAESKSQRAFAYGYLSHLAADSIAHNHFIPEMMLRSFSSPLLRHVYWELRFDALADKRVWQVPKRMVKSVHRDNDKLLSSLLEDTPLSFRTNKTIFSSMLSLQRVKRWHKMLGILSSSSKWTLRREDKERYFSICLEAIRDLLAHENKARGILEDPTGKGSLNLAKSMTRKLRMLKRDGKEWEGYMEKYLKGIMIKR